MSSDPVRLVDENEHEIGHANPLPVTAPTAITVTPSADVSYSSIISGELQGNANATQGPNRACKYVCFTALKTNVGNVYIGGAGVTKPDGTTDTTSGLELTPGACSPWIPVTNLNLLYRICDNAGDDVTYLGLV